MFSNFQRVNRQTLWLGTKALGRNVIETYYSLPNKSNFIVKQIVAFVKRSCCVSECVRACVRACVSEIPKTFESLLYLPPPPSSPPPFPSFSFFLLLLVLLLQICLLCLAPLLASRFSSLPLADPRSPEAKEARVPLRLTFSGMKYFARQIDGRLRKNTIARFAESVTCCYT